MSLASARSVTICSSVTSMIEPRPFLELRPIGLHDVGDGDLDQRVDRNVDREPQIDAELGEVERRPSAPATRPAPTARPGSTRVAPGMNALGIEHAVLRMARAGEGFGADQLFLAQVDLRLVPEFDPAVAQAPRRDRCAPAMVGGWPSLRVCRYLHDVAGLERLFQDRQHLQPVLLADALDVLEHGRAAAAHQLHGAGDSPPCRARSRIRWRRSIPARYRGRRASARGGTRRRESSEPSANSSVSMPAPCSMSDRKCRMLSSASIRSKAARALGRAARRPRS